MSYIHEPPVSLLPNCVGKENCVNRHHRPKYCYSSRNWEHQSCLKHASFSSTKQSASSAKWRYGTKLVPKEENYCDRAAVTGKSSKSVRNKLKLIFQTENDRYLGRTDPSPSKTILCSCKAICSCSGNAAEYCNKPLQNKFYNPCQRCCSSCDVYCKYFTNNSYNSSPGQFYSFPFELCKQSPLYRVQSITRSQENCDSRNRKYYLKMKSFKFKNRKKIDSDVKDSSNNKSTSLDWKKVRCMRYMYGVLLFISVVSHMTTHGSAYELEREYCFLF